MASIEASIGTELYKTTIISSTNVLVADEPIAAGGKDLGFSPDELLAAALGACTCATLRMYADRKGWVELQEVRVRVDFKRGAATGSSMVRTIELIGNLDNEQKNRLMEIANKCPVHNTLAHSVVIETFVI